MPSICARCGHANREGARFCAACGGALPERCEVCGAELGAEARFCDSCGAAVQSGRGGGVETRKVLSVVFADLVGSTELQASLDAEAVRGVMTQFYDAMRGVLQAHGGSLQKFIGDAVVAVFGVPTVREDDALRAVRAAAAMVVALGELNIELERRWGVRLQMRTGVHTGELVVSDEGVLVGDTMNTAARLEQAAGAGEVLIGEATWRLVHHTVALQESEPLALKGKAAPVRAWRLVSAASADRRRTAAADAPLVGREAELQRLHDAYAGVVSARRCRLVTLIGSPGVGKTRLASEFGAAVTGEAKVVEGHCEPTGEGITFLPVAEVLRAVANIGEADPPELVNEKLLALTPEGDPDRSRLVEGIAGVLGVAEPASAQETFWALRRAIEFLAAERPLVLVLDDVHWAQPMLLDLIEHLVEWVGDSPTLIVALARPELREAREAFASAGRRAADVIELEPLDEQESRELVAGLLGDFRVPPKLSARILETTEGNPLFLGETVRMLVDDGVLRQEGGAWVASGDVSDVDVPPTIHALLAARIERLRTDERAVVECAAVIGKQFYRGAVAERVSPPIRSELDGHLEALRRKDMVEPEGTYWIDEPVYRFHHVLIRDAAYRSLLKEARAELHERFADWLELKAGDLVGEHEDVIAFHLEQAHEYRRQLGAPDDRGRALGRRAAARLHSAGRRALAREDLAAAANLLGRALARDCGDEATILWDLSEALLSTGDTAAAAQVVGRLEEVAGEDPTHRARSTIVAGQLANLTGAGDLVRSAESVVAAATLLAERGDRLGEAKGFHVAAGAYARLGRVGSVEESLDRALAAARVAEDRRRITAVLAGAPRAALWGPSPVVRASGRCLDIVRILRMTPGNRHVEAIALRCQAVLEAMRGRSDAAREILAGGRASLEELGLAFELHETAVHAGIVELLAGDPGAAVEHLRRARAGFEALGVASGAAEAAALLARALVERGGEDEQALEQALFAETHGGEDLKTTITWCSARAQALAHLGEPEQAVEFARRAMSLAEPTDALADKADAAIALAEVLTATGRADEGREAARAAEQGYEAKGHAVGAERARRVSGETGRRPSEAGRAARPTGDRTPERFWSEWGRRYAERDVDGVLELTSEDWVLIDHRPVGWGETRGHDGARRILSSTFAQSPDVRFEVDEVLACDERVIAMRTAFRGRGRRAGEFESTFGFVSVVEDGRLVHVDLFAYDSDDAAMTARYAELGGGQALLGSRPPERYLKAWIRAHASRDMDAIAALTDRGFASVDHRKVGWEDFGFNRGDAVIRTEWEVTEFSHLAVDEVLACSDTALAARVCSSGSLRAGAGSYESTIGLVVALDDGLATSWDIYERDHDEAILARYAELDGRRSPTLGDRAPGVARSAARGKAPERYWAEWTRLYNAHDLDALLALYAEDWVLRDHSAVGWDAARGPEAAGKVIASSFEASPDIRFDIDEVLACDERVMAARIGYRGHAADGSGEFAVLSGSVSVIEDGRMVSVDRYGYEDDAAMIACYAELAGHGVSTDVLVRDRRGFPIADLRGVEAYDSLVEPGAARTVLERDGDLRLVRIETETPLMVVEELRDGRVAEAVVVGDEARARAWLTAFVAVRRHSAEDTAAIRDFYLESGKLLKRPIASQRVLDAYPGVAALETRGTGIDGTTGGSVGWWTFQANVMRDGLVMEVHSFEDPDQAAAKLCELSPHADHARLSRIYAEAVNGQDWSSLEQLYAPDCVFVERRPVAWKDAIGVGGFVAVKRRALELTPDLAEYVEIVADDGGDVYVVRQTEAGTWQGGSWERGTDCIVVLRDGVIVRTELFTPEQWAGLCARLEELRDEDGDDWESPIAVDATVFDRRVNGWGTLRGAEAISDRLGRSLSGEVLAANDGIAFLRIRDEALALALTNAVGEVSLAELFSDEDEARERHTALLEAPAGVAVMRVGFAWFDALNRRDRTAARACLTDDMVVVEHRPVSAIDVRDAETYINLLWSLIELSEDVHWWYREPNTPTGSIGRAGIVITGHWNAGGGWAEIPVDVVYAIREDRFERFELYAPGTVAEQEARINELRAQPASAS